MLNLLTFSLLVTVANFSLLVPPAKHLRDIFDYSLSCRYVPDSSSKMLGFNLIHIQTRLIISTTALVVTKTQTPLISDSNYYNELLL